MKSFKEFITEAVGPKEKAVIVFGRMNPPTIGHEKLLSVAENIAKKENADFHIYLTKTQDKKKNPLSFDEKRKILLKKYSNDVVKNGKYNTIFDVLVSLYDNGYKDIVLVAGSDRVKEFEVLIDKYNCKEARHGIYCFDSVTVKSAGERDPDKDDVSGVSASKVRNYALTGDYDKFKESIFAGNKLSEKEIKEIFDLIRTRL